MSHASHVTCVRTDLYHDDIEKRGAIARPYFRCHVQGFLAQTPVPTSFQVQAFLEGDSLGSFPLFPPSLNA